MLDPVYAEVDDFLRSWPSAAELHGSEDAAGLERDEDIAEGTTYETGLRLSLTRRVGDRLIWAE